MKKLVILAFFTALIAAHFPLSLAQRLQRKQGHFGFERVIIRSDKTWTSLDRVFSNTVAVINEKHPNFALENATLSLWIDPGKSIEYLTVSVFKKRGEPALLLFMDNGFSVTKTHEGIATDGLHGVEPLVK